MNNQKATLFSFLSEGKSSEFNQLANSWIAANPDAFLDLRNLDLNHKTLEGFNFSSCDISHCDFEGAVFSQCTFKGVKGILTACFTSAYFLDPQKDFFGKEEAQQLFLAIFRQP